MVNINDRNCIRTYLTLNGNMIEHVYKNNLSDCLKSKRIAQNEVNPERVVFSCQKVKAQTEIYMDRKKIVKILNNGTHLLYLHHALAYGPAARSQQKRNHSKTIKTLYFKNF